MGRLFVTVHEPRIASHVRGQYCRQPTLDPEWPLLHHGRQSNPEHTVRRITRQSQTSFDGMPTQAEVAYWQIVLQKSKVATARFFRENLKRKEVDDSHSLSRTTEVAHEFGARR